MQGTIREDEYKSWLKQGGAESPKGHTTRVYALRTIERKLGELGMPFGDLDAAWREDRFDSLCKELHRMLEDSRADGQDYRVLMPQAQKPMNRISNWRSWLAQYGRFLAGEPPGSAQAKDADRIRRYVLEHYIEPAREQGLEQVEVRVGDVNKALNLNQAWPNISQALAGRKFQELAAVPPPTRHGAELSPATVYTFDLDENPNMALVTATSSGIDEETEVSKPIPPVNLILYGPPGTGKTYSTVAEAVRLCGEPVPESRETLMRNYQRLLEAGRIEFVTFHQSMSYEDFVEGRQPVTDSDEEADSPSAGFRLETVPGIFRRIVKRAQTSQSRSTSGDAITVESRRVFKMSLGEARSSEGALLFDEAIERGYAMHGKGIHDWSDEKYSNKEAFRETYRAGGQPDASSSDVHMPYVFRNDVRQGDIVIVSRGDLLFRAIGVFTGGYEFHSGVHYPHRRNVRWHWVDHEGVTVSEICNKQRLSRQTIYRLGNNDLKIAALDRYLNSQRAGDSTEPESFVLVIDEINRANISKVFGELITLLEPDKRLGQPNALKVRLPYSGDDFGVPSNLHIVATMNTADRSIALLDTALRRRFAFREVMPNASLLDEAAKMCELDLPRILDTLNERIEYLYDREHQIGHAYFIDCTSRADVDAAMRDKVIPLLAEYFFEDWGKVAAVLGDAASGDQPKEGGFLNRLALKAPPGIEGGEDLSRFRWEVRSEDEGFDYRGLTEA